MAAGSSYKLPVIRTRTIIYTAVMGVVATAMLFAIYASRRWGRIGLVLWAFAATIFVGSIVLGWHYAVDGYAGALFTILTWKSVGLWLRRHGPEELAA